MRTTILALLTALTACNLPVEAPVEARRSVETPVVDEPALTPAPAYEEQYGHVTIAPAELIARTSNGDRVIPVHTTDYRAVVERLQMLGYTVEVDVTSYFENQDEWNMGLARFSNPPTNTHFKVVADSINMHVNGSEDLYHFAAVGTMLFLVPASEEIAQGLETTAIFY